MMDPIYLREIEDHTGSGPWAEMIRRMKESGAPVPQIMHLFAYKPDRTAHLGQFTQEVMRGPSPLSAGLRELIAAFTSRTRECPF
ncbi:MAG: peroxidase [Acidobacteriota bacterium]